MAGREYPLVETDKPVLGFGRTEVPARGLWQPTRMQRAAGEQRAAGKKEDGTWK